MSGGRSVLTLSRTSGPNPVKAISHSTPLLRLHSERRLLTELASVLCICSAERPPSLTRASIDLLIFPALAKPESL